MDADMKLPVMAPAVNSTRWMPSVFLGCWARRDGVPPFEEDTAHAYPYSRACGEPDTDALGLCAPHRARIGREVSADAR